MRPPGRRAAYDRYVAAATETISVIRPGVTGGEVLAAAQRAFERHDLSLVSGAVGVGLGYGPAERPYLAPGEIDPVQPGTVLSIEPATPEGLQASWTVVVEEGGARMLPSPFPLDVPFVLDA